MTCTYIYIYVHLYSCKLACIFVFMFHVYICIYRPPIPCNCRRRVPGALDVQAAEDTVGSASRRTYVASPPGLGLGFAGLFWGSKVPEIRSICGLCVGNNNAGLGSLLPLAPSLWVLGDRLLWSLELKQKVSPILNI